MAIRRASSEIPLALDNDVFTDVFIAAAALTHDHGIATRNQSDFELIGQYAPSFAPDLYLAIWKP